MLEENIEEILDQIHFFNNQFHDSENQPNLVGYHELMRSSKNRCQLMLLKFFSKEVVWIRKDFDQPNQEWLVGVYRQPEHCASHIPLSVLKKGLSDMQLAAWNIR